MGYRCPSPNLLGRIKITLTLSPLYEDNSPNVSLGMLNEVLWKIRQISRRHPDYTFVLRRSYPLQQRLWNFTTDSNWGHSPGDRAQDYDTEGSFPQFSFQQTIDREKDLNVLKIPKCLWPSFPNSSQETTKTSIKPGNKQVPNPWGLLK